jgi:uncharacterized protein
VAATRKRATSTAGAAPGPARHPATRARAAEQRSALALTRAENAELCAGCVKCCTYVTVEVDAPRSAWEYDQWAWALHHRGVELWVTRDPESWSVHFEAVCEELGEDGHCTIHGRHPVLCREYDPRSCERWFPLSDVRAHFRRPEELEEWLRRERPGHWRRLVAWRKAQTTPRAGRRTAIIPIRTTG